ncbi:hypothetical protein M0R45_005725 [Rubus argutus]|uniref:beta-galactosidase n=1 Tax=Rubus argutus TaxID=59490 RepID=A0AAW1YP32_RUBAR
MYHGGTNFGRTSGGPFITTSYDYEAPIDEYGLPRLPKWAHLKQLHLSIKLCEHVLLTGEPNHVSLGPSEEADVFTDSSGACAAFISNMDDKNDKTVVFRNVSYHLPAWSVSILPDCKTVVFNTAKVGSQTSVVEMASETKGLKGLKWDVFLEKAGIWGEADFVKTGLLITSHTQNLPLTICGIQQAYLLMKMKKLQDSASGNGTHSPFILKKPISLKAGKNEIALLSMTVGLQNAGSFYEWVGAGITSVKIKGFNNGTIDLSAHNWTYKAIVDPPPGDEPIGLDMIHMGKGLAWLNGEEIGRYWPRKSPTHGCVQECNYRGKFDPDKCNTGCGEPTQRWYHVPRSWFKPSGNVLVIFEEKGGDPLKIEFSRRKISGSCGSYAKGDCHDPNSISVVEKVCLNQNKCAIELTEEKFRKGLCPSVTKKLAVEVVCN